jgi:alkylated DNA repair dioxygenase AlkB
METSLLSDKTRHCQVTYEDDFLLAASADELFAFLQREAPFEKEAPLVFGKPRPISRASCAFGDTGVSYHYSGITRPAKLWPEPLRILKEKIETSQKAKFNFVLCNFYPDGQSGLGWHSDDEKDLVPNAPIASISLGAERDFYLRERDTHEVVVKIKLAHGSLLMMKEQTQKFYQHHVPKRAKCMTPRINLTFRRML